MARARFRRADALEILAEQVEDFAQVARAAIETRLQQVATGEMCDFWALVAKLDARGRPGAGEDVHLPG